MAFLPLILGTVLKVLRECPSARNKLILALLIKIIPVGS